MQDILQATVTLLALVNPAMCATIFMNGFGPYPPKKRALNALKAVGVIFTVLALSAISGANILSTFGVSLEAFSFAGGGILCFIGIKMPAEADSAGSGKGQEDQNTEASLTPLVLFAASPGTITGVITISSSHSGTRLPVSTLAAVLIVAAVLLVVLATISYLPRKSGKPSMGRQMITSYLGVIVIAMGVQFAFTGFKQFMLG